MAAAAAVLVAVVLVSHFVDAALSVESRECSCDESLINRQGFPTGFVFGTPTSHYQIEGAFDKDGKGQGLWDNYTHTYPDRILDKTNGDVACDSYHLLGDVQLMKNMGVDAYKFSISWTRILPSGTKKNGVNQKGIDHYNSRINELLANGIEPWVTLLHLDTPQALEDAYGGFLSRQIVDDFVDFADVIFNEFGDRVKYWITINEPWALSVLAYAKGVFAPGRCSSWVDDNCNLGGDSGVDPYIVNHNQLIAHAAIVKLYRNKYQELQKGQTGITVNSYWLVPYDNTYEDIKATNRSIDFMLGCMEEYVGNRLPKFTQEEAQLLKGSFDFIGLNYYMGSYAKNEPKIDNNHLSVVTDPQATVVGEKDGVLIGPRGSSYRFYYSYPKGILDILRYMKEKYDKPLIYVTKNGVDENNNVTMSVALQDHKRKKYFFQHLCCLREAITEYDANVKGVFSWSLVDNYDFTTGYLVRFGFHYVDFKDKYLRRYRKELALWFKNILTKDTPSTGISDQ